MAIQSGKARLGVATRFRGVSRYFVGTAWFELTRRLDVGDQRDMHDHHVFGAGLQLKLADRFKERETFNVSGGSADLRDDHVAWLSLSVANDTALYFIGDMRNHLNGLAQVITSTFLGQDGLVNLAAGHVIGPCEYAARESLVVT